MRSCNTKYLLPGAITAASFLLLLLLRRFLLLPLLPLLPLLILAIVNIHTLVKGDYSRPDWDTQEKRAAGGNRTGTKEHQRGGQKEKS